MTERKSQGSSLQSLIPIIRPNTTTPHVYWHIFLLQREIYCNKIWNERSRQTNQKCNKKEDWRIWSLKGAVCRVGPSSPSFAQIHPHILPHTVLILSCGNFVHVATKIELKEVIRRMRNAVKRKKEGNQVSREQSAELVPHPYYPPKYIHIYWYMYSTLIYNSCMYIFWLILFICPNVST